MRAILAPIPQSKGRLCSLEHRFLCNRTAPCLSFHPPDSPHSALWRCQWVVSPPHPFCLRSRATRWFFALEKMLASPPSSS